MAVESTMRGKILCLINSAAYSRPYFEQLSSHLIERGFTVCFALDSHLSDFQYADGVALEGASYFTDFVAKNLFQVNEIAAKAPTTWSSLFSDFDRFLTMDIPTPLSKTRAVEFRHIPALLTAFFERLFELERPTAVLYEPVSNSFAIAAFQQAEVAGIPFLSLSPSRLPGRIEISMTGALRDHETLADVLARSHEGAISDESRSIARRYIAAIDAQTPDYMKTNGLDNVSLVGKYASLEKLRHFMKGRKYRNAMAQDCVLAYQHGDPVALSVAFAKRALMRRLRLSRVTRLYRTTVADGDFFLYPLHFHPEASTSVWAADYVDELNLIKSIAFRLPSHVRLVVKEHPSAVALQPVSFYRQLRQLPNVELVAPGLPTKSLIRRSLGIVCLTSTVGFEAAVLNKPVIVMGNVFYSYFPNVQAIRDYSQLTPAIERALRYKPQTSETLIEATAAYVEFGAPGSFDFRASLGNHQALDQVATVVADTLSRGS